MGGQKAIRRSDSHETLLVLLKLLKKVVERNGMGIGFPVIKIRRKKHLFQLVDFEKQSFWGLGGQNANRRFHSRET